ncbi:pancreatic lipase-related protein 2-like [Pseudomyrmex gracilis]|uniref:pancreatic lipase-related protein 2-like n=1 Tax=Pseudomyrmex gracilis TaxID=219809 RepID=UPI000995A54F|nr:pancreatic lipase-related protein 2-like [Pseudomyrmex gracilis]
MLLSMFFIFLFLNVPFNIADLPVRRPSIQDLHPEKDILNVFLNPTVVSTDHVTIGNILDLDFKAKNLNYELYTKDNTEQPVFLRVGDTAQLKDSPFNYTLPTKILVHGWTDNGNTFWLNDVRRNYLSVGDYNVICINWFAGSNKEYLTSVRLTRQVGEYVAEFIEFLTSETELSFDNIHILGHSLGAHIAGYVGNYVSKKLGRITGLDPARPAYETPYLKDTEERLDPTDANFVDIIHTCAGSLGFLRPIGHIDFYPNGGTFRQPGCPFSTIWNNENDPVGIFAEYCSHGRSHQFFAESIVHPNGFIAVQCATWIDFQLGKCNNSNTAVMGEFISSDERGIFYLETNAQPPFGKNEIR